MKHEKAAGQNGKFKEYLSRNLNMYMIPLAIIALSLFFWVQNPRFFSATNFSNVARQIAVLGIATIGQFVIIVVGGIDLAQGSLMGLGGCVTALLTIPYGFLTALLASFASCLFYGLLAGVLVARLKIPAFIVGLGGLNLLRGLVYILTGGMPISGAWPPIFEFLGNGSVLGIPTVFILTVILYVVAYLFLKYTRMGREFFSVGGNEEAARLSGINTVKRRIQAYMIGSLITSVAAVALLTRVTVGQPDLGDGYQMQTIAAAVIGGASLQGGEGKIVYAAFGVLLIGIIANGLNLMRVSSFTQQMVNGIIIVLAVYLDIRQKKSV